VSFPGAIFLLVCFNFVGEGWLYTYTIDVLLKGASREGGMARQYGDGDEEWEGRGE